MKKNKINKSNTLYKKAIKIIPGGSQTFSKGVSQFVDGVAPKFLEKGKGAYVYDLDNNKYLDYIMGCHPLILGYSDPDVNKSVIRQLQKGSTFSLMNKLEYDVSNILCKSIPSAEMVRFGKNGADVTSIAIKIARAVTGRDHIAFSGYHGWHDWFISTTDLNGGIPKSTGKLIHKFEYNNIDSLEKLFSKYKNKIAAVIMEPLTVESPKCQKTFCSNKKCKIVCQKSFLNDVREMTKKNNSLLIFDEIITGFRFDYGGAQKLTNVTPDLSCFAKAISNGVPLSAIVGKKKYMSVLDKVFFSFTYGGDCIGLAAAKTSLKKIKDHKVIPKIYKNGKLLKDSINFLIRNYNLEKLLNCIGFDCRTILTFSDSKYGDNLVLKSIIQQELIKRGILWSAYHAISYCHTTKEINKTVNAFDFVFKKIRKIIDSEHKFISYLEGKPVKPVFRKVTDFNSMMKNSY
tara:strand:- start:1357 stop:2733 length:1377 start_codon:yes stop_codon:yes gene_type:complete